MNLTFPDQQQQQVSKMTKQIDSSNFFSTQPLSSTAHNFYTQGKQQLKSRNNLIRKRYPNKKSSLQSLEGSRSLFVQQKELDQEGSVEKMKKCKDRLKQTKSMFLNELQLTHRKQAFYDSLMHHTNVLKHQFIHLYQIKKHRLDSQRISLKGKIQKEDFLRSSFDSIKMKKKLREDSLIEMRRSESLLLEQRVRRSKIEKQELEDEMNRTMRKESEWKLERTCEVLDSANRFALRKGQMQKLKRIKSRFNYSQKINQEKQLIQDYKQILAKITQENPELLRNNNYRNPDQMMIQLMSERGSARKDQREGKGSVFKNDNRGSFITD